MKILDVIQSCDTLFPNEFDFKEKLMWCDELGSLLMREHMRIFDTLKVSAKNGGYEIPSEINFWDIERLIIGGRIIRKKDGRWNGMRYLSEPKGNEGIAINAENTDSSNTMEIVYLRRYTPIRNIEISDISITVENSIIKMNRCPFIEGDTINICIDSVTYTAVINAIEQNEGLQYILTLDTDLGISGSFVADMSRVITDETVCPSPFDVMYIDFLNAKICFYQRDYKNYNRHMTVFNSRLKNLDTDMMHYAPQSPDSKLRNWY